MALAMAALTPYRGPDGKAGEGILVGLPVVDEQQETDDDSGRVTLKRIYYDVDAELDPAFILRVWNEFSAWRAEQISPGMVRAVGESSGATTSSGSSESSIEPTAPPSTIPGS